MAAPLVSRMDRTNRDAGMRILLTTTTHSRFHWGGLAQSCARVTEGLAARGHTVTVAVFDVGHQYWDPVAIPATHATARRGTVTIEFVPKDDALPEHAPAPQTLAERLQQAYLRLRLLAAAHEPDVLVSFFPVPVGYPASLVAQERGIPLVLAFRGNDIGRFVHDPIHLPLLVQCLRTAAATTFVARDLERLARCIVPRLPPSTIIYNGIDPSLLDRAWRRPAARDPVFGAVGVFKRKKGMELFVRVVASDPALQRRIKLIGDFPQRPASCAALGDALTGIVPRDQALVELDRLDVFVAPSLTDGCPNAVLEAMAAGRAILCSPVGAMRDLLVDLESCCFLPDWTETAMRDAITRLDRDAGLRERIGAGARAVAEGLTVERELDAWERLLRDAVAAGATS